MFEEEKEVALDLVETRSLLEDEKLNSFFAKI